MENKKRSEIAVAAYIASLRVGPGAQQQRLGTTIQQAKMVLRRRAVLHTLPHGHLMHVAELARVNLHAL